MLASIIIPFYNARPDVIRRCLDSIYDAGLPKEEFEVIVVDDCSSDRATVEKLAEYQHVLPPPVNLKIISHKENRRQGGARNTAISEARGDWAIYIDQDDYFKPESLSKMFDLLRKSSDEDLIMCDYESVEEGTGKVLETGHYSRVNSIEPMDGPRYIRAQEVPWFPWCTVYRISFLRREEIWFEEKVRFEDSDYVLKALWLAKEVRFVPICLVCHTVSDTQQSAVGNNFPFIEDLFKISDRVRKLGELVMLTDKDTGIAILGHHFYKHKYDILRYLWRLSPRQIWYILCTYPVHTPSSIGWLDFTARFPRLTAVAVILAKPILPLVRKAVLARRG